MQVTTRSIILSSTKYGDTSLIVKAFTEQLGVLTLMARGVRKRHSSNPASLFQHLSLVEIVFRYREQRDIQHLIETRQIHPYSGIPFDQMKGSIILFINELLLKSIREQEANPKMFSYVFKSLMEFDAMQKGSVDFHLLFCLHLTKFLGFMPQGTWSEDHPYFNLREGTFTGIIEPVVSMNSEHSSQFSKLLHTSLDEIHSLRIGNSLRKALIDYLVEYYQLHLPGFGKMKSLEVLESIYS